MHAAAADFGETSMIDLLIASGARTDIKDAEEGRR
jgi:hypothetical protein